MSFGANSRAMPISKYGAKKTEYSGIVFDSKKEAKHYERLLLMQKAGLISNLTLQKSFELQPKFKHGNTNERAINYRADFVYTLDGKEIVVDVKGFKTDVYNLKRKMLLYRYPDISFVEV